MKLANDKGEAVYYNPAVKHGKPCYVIVAISGQTILGRDKQKRKSRTFVHEYQAEAWLRRNGYETV